MRKIMYAYVTKKLFREQRGLVGKWRERNGEGRLEEYAQEVIQCHIQRIHANRKKKNPEDNEVLETV